MPLTSYDLVKKSTLNINHNYIKIMIFGWHLSMKPIVIIELIIVIIEF